MFLPATIDLANSEKYTLSIRIDSKKFMFSLSRPNEGKNFCFRETHFENTNESMLERLQRIIFELNFLTQQFAQVNVIFVSTNYQVIPDDFFEKGEESSLHRFLVDEGPDFILDNKLPKYKVQILSGVDEEVYGFMKRSLYNPVFYNQSAVLINYLEGSKKATALNSRMYVNLSDTIVDIIGFSGANLLHASSYQGLSIREQAYYVLKIWEALGLDQISDQLLIVGDPDDALLSVLRKYIKNIEKVGVPNEVYLWSQEALLAPIDLLSLSL